MWVSSRMLNITTRLTTILMERTIVEDEVESKRTRGEYRASPTIRSPKQHITRKEEKNR